MQRLQLDYVDLVFCHRPDPCTPIEETVRAMNWVIDQGKAFYWGTRWGSDGILIYQVDLCDSIDNLSEWSADQIMEAHQVAQRLNLIGPIMEQPQVNQTFT